MSDLLIAPVPLDMGTKRSCQLQTRIIPQSFSIGHKFGPEEVESAAKNATVYHSITRRGLTKLNAPCLSYWLNQSIYPGVLDCHMPDEN